MGAITVTWTAKDANRLLPGKPITTGLKNDEWDDLLFLMQWLGNSFLAGAVQDHDHDGANSALIEVGPNLLRNPSFESDGSSWAFTDFTGGSHAFDTANEIHGAKSLAITSTVLANGGGEAISNQFIAVGGSEFVPWRAWVKASVANVSSRVEIVWYDDAQAQVSAAQVYNVTNTPTASTQQSGTTQAPATARFMKLRLTGGVPGAGSATGTIYFDGAMLAFVLVDTEVTQPKLKTTTGSVSSAGTANLTLPGGQYGFYPETSEQAGGTAGNIIIATADIGTSLITQIGMQPAGGFSLTARQRYIQASPPYDLGDGATAFFCYGLIERVSAKVLAAYLAEDPPFAYNGPTDIRPHYHRNGRGYQRVPQILAEHVHLEQAIASGMPRDVALRRLVQDPIVEREVTAGLKNADMALIPHPFPGDDLTGKTVVLIDPVSAFAADLQRLNAAGARIDLHDGSIILDNTPLPRAAPPGVMPVAARWKLTP